MKYLPSILVFGLGVHLIYLIPLGVVLGVGYAHFSEVEQAKQRTYAKWTQNEATSGELSKRVAPHVERLSFFRSVIHDDQPTAIGGLLAACENDAGGNLKREVFRKEQALRFITPENKAPAEEFGMVYSGRFGALQATGLRLEKQRPNLILTSQTLTAPSAERDTGLLRAEMTYLSLTESQP
jgi:hypothetical protein